MTVLMLLFLATLFLSYSNGANDNFKGVATLFGSGTTNYKSALWLATTATFAGSLSSIFLAGSLVKSFSGKGLVPDAIALSPDFLLSVSLGGASTVMLATVLGFPISTTHSLIGALIGSGLMAVGTNVDFTVLGNSLLLPLLISPLIALTLAALLYSFFRAMRVHFGVTKEWCLCIGETEKNIPLGESATVMTDALVTTTSSTLAKEEICRERYRGKVLGINCQKALDIAHYISAGIVSFARGLNDTPKIVALLLAIEALELRAGMLVVALGMASGGLLNARKVAITMSKKITSLNHGQGFTANIVTGALVVFASRLGIPVSTTHVSVASLFGIGVITKKANRLIISEILLSWILTLPVAAILSGCMYFILNIAM